MVEPAAENTPGQNGLLDCHVAERRAEVGDVGDAVAHGEHHTGAVIEEVVDHPCSPAHRGSFCQQWLNRTLRIADFTRERTGLAVVDEELGSHVGLGDHVEVAQSVGDGRCSTRT